MPSTELFPTHDTGVLRLALIIAGLCLAVLLTGMDQTILATAAPTISDDLHALDDTDWWTNIYLLMPAASKLPNSTALIFGRAIAGLGASGIFSGGVFITTKLIPLAHRPAHLAIAGPFIGGALTDRSTCSLDMKEKIAWFDIRTVLTVAGLLCLLLGLQWGGGIYSWSNARLVALLVLSVVLLVAFARWQLWDRSTDSRTIPTTISYAIGLTNSLYVTILYLPFWLQIIRSKSPLSSGVLLAPTIGAYIVGSVAGALTTATEYYNPGLILGFLLLILGAALLTNLNPTTPTSKVFGQPSCIVQALIPECDNLSASVSVAAGQSVFKNSLVCQLPTTAPETNRSGFLQRDAGNILSAIPLSDQSKRLGAISGVLVKPFILPLQYHARPGSEL
ncbi:uncharacterized protein BDR25DRAFT_324151 [Lindgomyces ingoldianus]|uniref:Uncharacterized protein n=1 Tax=Lindgomyces ingoldianus TaxID=673940 RepID=A0ACB6R203_9PLEO|nr:uncharacterized protein BDR25DRAFT_324151 [Lindgomyces ingoldianus]KAF2472853.1 hypothetical protein BDR25DRAFT_324151 [Lindgomyces ingoldianus]